MKNLPIDLLRTFVSVSDVGGFTSAGELLGRTQPTVSLQVKRLEGLLNQTLLYRNGSRVSLTTAGEDIYQYAQKILSLNDEAVGLYANDGLTGHINLGIPSEFATTLLPKVISRFSRTYPNVTIEVTCALSKELLTGHGRDKYDLILALYDDYEEAGGSLIQVDELVWVTNKSHDNHKKPVMSLVVAPNGCIYRNRGIKVLDELDLPWQVVYTIPDLTGILSAINEGIGVTVLAKSVVPSSLDIVRSSDKFPALGSVGISLVKANRRPIEAVDRLAEYFVTCLS